MIEKAWGAGLLALALCGCNEAEPDSEADHADADAGVRADAQSAADGGSDSFNVYVGEVEDSDVRVAILSDDSHARLFFCGSASSVGDKTHWFNLARDSDTIESEEAQFRVEAQFTAAAVSGEYKVGDETRSFSASKALRGTLSGLYEGKGDCGRLGLILIQRTPDADIEAQGACVGPGHAPEQVNPILPISLQNGSVRVEAKGQEDGIALQPAGVAPL